MQLVQQTLIINASKTTMAVCRWDNIKKVLMFQNRSKDCEMCLDDYLDRFNTSIKQAKAQGFIVKVTDVPIGSKWPTIETLKGTK